MTREEFVAGWLERSGMSAEQLAEVGLSAEPCACEWDGCEGWGMVRKREDAELQISLRLV